MAAPSRFSAIRVAWVLCLLACCGVIATQVWAYGQRRAWHEQRESITEVYAHWTAGAQREARELLGDVEGLTRDEATARLRDVFGPDEPYTRLPSPPGAVYMAYIDIHTPPREWPVSWHLRRRNWVVIVTMYDGKADGLFVDMMNSPFPRPRPPWQPTAMWMLVIAGCGVAIAFASVAAVLLWVAGRSHRPAVHVLLMAVVLASVIVLAEDWEIARTGPWRPTILGGARLRSVPWEGPVIGLVIALIALRVPSRRHTPGLCASCGYDLKGNTSGVCPECGTAITPPPPPAASNPMPAAATR